MISGRRVGASTCNKTRSRILQHLPDPFPILNEQAISTFIELYLLHLAMTLRRLGTPRSRCTATLCPCQFYFLFPRPRKPFSFASMLFCLSPSLSRGLPKKPPEVCCGFSSGVGDVIAIGMACLLVSSFRTGCRLTCAGTDSPHTRLTSMLPFHPFSATS